MAFFHMVLGLALVGGGIAWLTGPRQVMAARVGITAAAVLAMLGLVPAVAVLAGHEPLSLSLNWYLPGMSLSLGIDPLSAFFLLPVLGLPVLAAIYGGEYFSGHNYGRHGGALWFFFNLLTLAMALVVTARNAVLFLIAWEIMTLASFFLVTHHDEDAAACKAGWLYLVAAHVGTLFLILFFLFFGVAAESFDFARFPRPAAAGLPAGMLFLFALIGFGTKAGIPPLHIWLPEAHPAAPAPVSAVMSGVMIKTGIYGLLRALLLLGPPPLGWGWTVTAAGIAAGLFGVLFALAQHDLKRLLAYHSVENIGIILLGIGLGLLGIGSDQPILAVLGFAGALLHVLNHALFKGLLFLGAGAVERATGTRNIEALGGLLRRMPWTGGMFLLAACAISGLPPLNGFVSEFLIFLGAITGIAEKGNEIMIPGVAIAAGLALIGGLAAACFAKAGGIVFLGEPRTPAAAAAQECGWRMRLPMLVLAVGCVLGGILAPWFLPLLAPVLEQTTGLDGTRLLDAIHRCQPALNGILVGALLLAGFLLWLMMRSRGLLAGREVRRGPTWDCGYARPTARMQYTAAAFARPLLQLFHGLVKSRERQHLPQAVFPGSADYESETPDAVSDRALSPAARFLAERIAHLRFLQQGRVHLYVFYIMLTLLVLLLWKL